MCVGKDHCNRVSHDVVPEVETDGLDGVTGDHLEVCIFTFELLES